MATQSSQLQIAVEGAQVYIQGGTNDEFWAGYTDGSWEPDTRSVFKRFIDPQHSYIDIGAWIGPTLLLGCQLAKRAYGIEPDPIAYAELVENVKLNRSITSNVHLFNICIAAKSGKVSFGSRGTGGDSMSSLLFSSKKTNWTVNAFNFLEWMEQNQIDDCSFIKIDIEGGEYSVIPTMVEYLKCHRPTLHLSLHPGFLGELDCRGMKARLQRSVLRLANTIKLLRILSFYKYLYNPFGKVQGRDSPGSLRSFFRPRLHDRLAGISWKPVVLLMVCLFGVSGRLSALVLTDQEW